MDRNPLAHSTIHRLSPDVVVPAEIMPGCSTSSTLPTANARMKGNGLTGVCSNSDHIGAGDQGQWKFVAIDPLSHPDVQVVESHMCDFDQDFTWARNRVGNIDCAKNFFAPMSINTDRLHGRRL